MNSNVHLQVADGVARLTLARPARRNALTRGMLELLIAALERTAADPALRCLIVSAEGPVFCAGMDLAEMQAARDHSDPRSQWQIDAALYREVIERLFQWPSPTIAVVAGPVAAGGVGLVAACDIVLASEQATFLLPEPQRGVVAAVVTPLLCYKVGPGSAGHLLLSLAGWNAEQALRSGLCQQIASADALHRSVDETIDRIRQGSPQAMRETKRFLRICTAAGLKQQLDEAAALSALARESSDAREGLLAFLEKRPPAWQATLDASPEAPPPCPVDSPRE